MVFFSFFQFEFLFSFVFLDGFYRLFIAEADEAFGFLEVERVVARHGEIYETVGRGHL